MTMQTTSTPSSPPRDEVLSKILERLDGIEGRLARLDDMAAEAPKAIATAVDTFDETARRLAESGVDVDKLVTNTVAAATRLGALLESKEFAALMDSGVLDPETLAVVGRAGEALHAARQEPAGEAGLFGVIGALGDRDVRRTVDFVLRVARRFGSAGQNHAQLGTGSR